MFWGLILKPDIRYKHVVEKPFRITNACLEFKKPEDKACVKLLTKEMEFIVCYLDGKNPQKGLEMSFEVGEMMTLVASGNAIVHLTGESGESSGFSDEEEEDMQMLESDEDASFAIAPKKKRAAAAEAAAVIRKKQRIDRGDAESDDDDDEDDESFLAPVEVDDSYVDSSDEHGSVEDDESGSDDDEDEEIESEEGSEDEEDFDMMEDEDESDEEEEEEEEVKPKEVKKPKGKKSEPQSPGKKEEGSPVKQNGVAHTNGEAESAKKKKKKNKKNKNKSDEGVTPAKETQAQKHPVQTPGGKSFNVDGVLVTTTQKGNGPVAKKGRNVNVYYRGVLKTTGAEFDKLMSGKGLRFKLGSRDVIPGWEKGIEGMKVGEKRRLEIPPQHAYGNKKMGPIPPNSTLIFDIELKAVS